MALRRIFVEKRQGFFDIPASLLKDELSETFRLTDLKAVRLIHRYDIEGLSDREYAKVRATVFSEPPVDRLYEETLPEFKNSRLFAMEYLPGQYDQRAASAAECAQLVTGKERPVVKTAIVVVLVGNITDEVFEKIKDYMINKIERQEAVLEKPEKISIEHPIPGNIEILNEFLKMDEAQLKNMITERGFAMSLKDLKFCQNYFKNIEHRPPTITELRVIDTYWSDHCRHTTFTTAIDDIIIEEGFASRAVNAAFMLYLSNRDEIYGDTNRPMTLMDIATIGMKALKKAGLLSDLDESDEINACSINVKVKINDKYEDWLLMFKNETHNHPTEIEPFGGAATCLGGAIRDPLSGRAYVYQAMRLTGAADPRKPISETLPGKLPQKKITQGAAAGYSSYGNQIGLATGEVHEVYHEGYLAKRMEIGAVIAAAPKENVVRKPPYAGDIVVLVGGRTGRDGLGGATGSSKEHTTESLTTCGAEVQKGNPVEERKIQRLFRNSKISKLIKRCNDFGAGGVAVAIGELAEGLSIDLDSVPKKYEGLDGTEIAISESQERMAVVISQNDVETFIKGAEEENLEATPVAYVTDDKTLLMRWRGETIVDLKRSFLDTNGVQEHITSRILMPNEEENYFKTLSPAVKNAGEDLEKAWLNNLSDLNVCSNKGLAERFDSTIGANTVLMPFGGKNQITPSGGAVAKLPVLNGETDTTSVMTYGLNPQLLSWSPFHGALYSVVEAVSKAVALSCDYDKVRLTLQEYFERLGEDEERWGKPTAALLGALLAQSELKTPAIGGKDSMSGTFMDLSVPPTLAAFAVGVTESEKIVSPEFKYIGNKVYIIKADRNEDEIPDFTKLRRNFAAVSKLIKARKVFSAATVGVGGVAATVTKMALGNDIGFKFEKPMKKQELFAASYGTFLLEVGEDTDISGDLKGVDYELLGVTTEAETVVCGKASILLIDAKEAYSKSLEKIFPTGTKKNSGDTATIVPYHHGNKIFARGARIAKPRVFIPVFPGTNCEYDTARAFEKAGAETDILVVRNLTPKDIEETVLAIVERLKKAKILMFPGGFSGGDEPDGSGKFIAAVFRNSKIANEVMNLLNRRDGLILGICNGFQALIKLGLLPYGEIRPLVSNSPTLTFNTIGRHVSTMVTTKVVSNLSPWLNKVEVGDIHTIPVSHGEGRFVADAEIIAKMRVAGQIATQYIDKKGQPTMEFPFNPNGSVNAIEGITSPNGRIFGKMGHSERIGNDNYKNVPGNYDQKLFEAGVDYFK